MFVKAFKTSLPALFSYLPLGVVYGMLCVENGNPWYFAPLLCTFVLAGAMQFLALTIIAADGSLLTVALAIFPLGIRNIFYGLTVLERYKNINPFLRLYLAHGLVDATYSLLGAGPRFDEKNDGRYITCLTALIHSYWVLGGLLGSFVNYFLTIPEGLEFLLTAFFTASAAEQFRKNKNIKPLLIAALSLLLAICFFPKHFFLTGIGIALTFCLTLPQTKKELA